MFQMPSKFNVQIDTCTPFDTGHATHDLLINTQASNRGNMVIHVHLDWHGHAMCPPPIDGALCIDKS